MFSNVGIHIVCSYSFMSFVSFDLFVRFLVYCSCVYIVSPSIYIVYIYIYSIYIYIYSNSVYIGLFISTYVDSYCQRPPHTNTISWLSIGQVLCDQFVSCDSCKRFDQDEFLEVLDIYFVNFSVSISYFVIC